MEEAHSFEARGSEDVMDSDPADKIHALADRMTYLERAQDGYRSTIEIINWMPPSADLPGLRRQADEALTRVRGKIEKLKEEVQYNNREQARIVMETMRTKDTELYRIRIAKMLEHVKELYDLHDYTERGTDGVARAHQRSVERIGGTLEK